MGIGSPRLLGQFVLRTALAALVSFACAPSALADDGGIVADSGQVGPVAAAMTVPAASPAGTEAAQGSPSTPATPVATPLSSTASPVQATVDTSGSQPRVRVRTIVAPPSSIHVATAAGNDRQAVRRGLSKDLSSSQEPATRLSFPLGVAGSSRIGAPVRGLLPPASRADSPVPGPAPRVPEIPSPAPSGLGFAGPSSAAAGAGIALLLLALAAWLALLRAPGLGRRVSLLLAAPRPYPYLLQLERPD
jgi:hypothetical protein